MNWPITGPGFIPVWQKVPLLKRRRAAQRKYRLERHGGQWPTEIELIMDAAIKGMVRCA